jgi:hypothetical protein
MVLSPLSIAVTDALRVVSVAGRGVIFVKNNEENYGTLDFVTTSGFRARFLRAKLVENIGNTV